MGELMTHRLGIAARYCALKIAKVGLLALFSLGLLAGSLHADECSDLLYSYKDAALNGIRQGMNRPCGDGKSREQCNCDGDTFRLKNAERNFQNHRKVVQACGSRLVEECNEDCLAKELTKLRRDAHDSCGIAANAPPPPPTAEQQRQTSLDNACAYLAKWFINHEIRTPQSSLPPEAAEFAKTCNSAQKSGCMSTQYAIQNYMKRDRNDRPITDPAERDKINRYVFSVLPCGKTEYQDPEI